MSASTRAELVRWPEQADRRDALAAAGIPCLLVVHPGAPIPPIVRGEDWIRATDDERDAATRLQRLTRAGRTVADLPAVVLPHGLDDDERRVARRLLASVGAFTPIEDLPVDDVDAVVATLREAFSAIGLQVTDVGGAGFLLEPSDAGPA